MAGRKSTLPIPDDCPEELKCSRCKKVKHRDEFVRNRSSPTTFSHQCKVCNDLFVNESRFRREIEEVGLVAFEAGIKRDLELARMKARILQEQLDERVAMARISKGEEVPEEVKARLSDGSLERIAKKLVRQLKPKAEVAAG